MKEFMCRDTGKDCDWKATAETDQEILKQAFAHGHLTHGSRDFSGDRREGLRAKIRVLKPLGLRGP